MVVQDVKAFREPPPPDPFFVPEHFVFPSTKDMALVVRNPRAWQPTNETADDSKLDHSLLELCLTSSKGLGLFAKKDIKTGTCILSETPLVVLPSRDCSYHDLQLQLLKLQPPQLDLFHSLCTNSASFSPAAKRSIEKSINSAARITRRALRDGHHLQMEARKVATFKANATPMSPRAEHGIFPLFSRVNHDCAPNVFASYNPTLGAHTVYAIRNIKAQEELLVSYIDPVQLPEDRDDDLAAFDFDCACESCFLYTPTKAQEKSGANSYTIQHLQAGLAVYAGDDPKDNHPEVVPTDPTIALHMAESAIDLMRAEKLVGPSLARLHRQASRYSLQLRKVEKAKSHAQMEAAVEKLCLGTETGYLNGKSVEDGGGNAAAWMQEVERMMEKDRVKIRMCEKRVAKETKKAEKKAEKKAAKDKR